MDRLTQLQIFVRVADLGSFTRAAHTLAIRQSTVSKGVAQLEERLGARLLLRSPKGVRLTEDGEQFLVHCRRLLDGLQDAEAALRQEQELQGVLRVAAPAAFGRLQLTHRLAAFMRRHPQLRLELTLGDDWSAHSQAGIDVAIRLGPQQDSSLVARRIGATRRVLVAAPTYFEAHEEPRHPHDLLKHDCVVFRPRFAAMSWAFTQPSVTVPVRGRFESDNAEACLQAAVEGLGVALLPSWMCDAPLLSGRLVRTLEGSLAQLLPVYAVMPSGRLLPRRTRALVSFLAEEFRIDPTLTAYGAHFS